ncbi:MAG: helix-turn-helix domain-containing protein [Alphaproteobacteria bacterium]|nr:helix-turn-helix domain-containing protein [Alphaproteobacteria bacterium]
MPTATEQKSISTLSQRLGALDDKVVSRLNEISHSVSSLAGRSIIIEGDPAISVFSLQHGIASVFKLLPDGRRQITGFLYPGDFLGVTFNMDAEYGYGAEAVTHCTLRAWPRPALEHLFDEAPGLRRLFLAKIADELTEAQDRMLMLGHRSIEERVAAFLLTMARRQAGATGIRIEIVDIPMRWADIADYLGTTAETVSRTLSAFRDRGIVRTGKRGEIGILNWPALEAHAAGVKAQEGEIDR